MNKALLFSAFSGLISALLLIFAIAMPFTVLFLPVPLLIAGFLAGTQGVLLATATAAVIIVLSTGFPGLTTYLVVAGLPAIALIRLVYRAPVEATDLESYHPRGFWGDAYVLLSVVTVLAIAIGSQLLDPTFIAAWTDMVRAFYSDLFPDMTPEDQDILVTNMMGQLPGAMAVVWIGLLLLNAALAKSLATKISNARLGGLDTVVPPLGRWRDMRLPQYWDVIVAGMVLFSYLPGTPGVIASFAVIPVMLGLLLAGLATAHTFFGARMESPVAALIAMYLFLALLTVIIAPLLIGLGLADHLYRLRDRIKSGSAPTLH